MALQSMTGFARHASRQGSRRIIWEVKSVNGKGLDARFRLPPGLESVEQGARALVSSRFSRGNFQASLAIEQEEGCQRAVINEPLLAELVAVAERLRAEYGLSPPTPEGLLSLRGVLDLPQSVDTPEQREALEEAILSTLDGTLAALEAARRAEGDALSVIIIRHVDQISALAEQARGDPARSADAIRARLAAQVSLLMEAGTGLDEARLFTEAAFLAARADIQEELDRLDAHVVQARKLIAEGGSIGRRLDFLSQEFNREANTLCSKSNAASISAIGLELKAVVDQFREQVQNLE